MITIEAATKSFDRMTGIFFLILLIIAVVVYIYVGYVRQKASANALSKCKAEMKKLVKRHESEIKKIQTHAFVKSFEANERIRELEQQLCETQNELRRTQENYIRLQSIAERVSINGKS